MVVALAVHYIFTQHSELQSQAAPNCPQYLALQAWHSLADLITSMWPVGPIPEQDGDQA